MGNDIPSHPIGTVRTRIKGNVRIYERYESTTELITSSRSLYPKFVNKWIEFKRELVKEGPLSLQIDDQHLEDSNEDEYFKKN